MHKPSDPLAGHQATAKPRAVRGWLLILCLMLTVVGPIISVGLMVHGYRQAAALAATSIAMQLCVVAALGLSAWAVAVGMRAGWRLWLIRPRAVQATRRALCLGLAVDVATTALQVGMALDPGDRFLSQVEWRLMPSLVFFTLCMAYLNHSKRVQAVFGPT